MVIVVCLIETMDLIFRDDNVYSLKYTENDLIYGKLKC